MEGNHDDALISSQGYDTIVFWAVPGSMTYEQVFDDIQYCFYAGGFYSDNNRLSLVKSMMERTISMGTSWKNGNGKRHALPSRQGVRMQQRKYHPEHIDFVCILLLPAMIQLDASVTLGQIARCFLTRSW